MSNDNRPGGTSAARAGAAARLVNETGITQPQARELVDLIGINWNSLIREARLLKKS